MARQIGVEKTVLSKSIVLVVKREIAGIIKLDTITDGLTCESRTLGEQLTKWKGKYLI